MMVLDFQKGVKAPLPEKPTLLDKERFKLRQRLLQEEVDELQTGFDFADMTQIADAIGDCLYILLGTAHEFGICDRLPQIFEEIHRSNMSKLDENGNAIFREDGKVLKPETYSKPNLEAIMERDYTVYKPLRAVADDVAQKMWEDFGVKVDEAILKKLKPKDREQYKNYLENQVDLNKKIKIEFDTVNLMHRATVTLYDKTKFEVIE